MGNTPSSSNRTGTPNNAGNNSSNNSPPRSTRGRSASSQQTLQGLLNGSGGGSTSTSNNSRGASGSVSAGGSNDKSTKVDEAPPPPPLFPQEARVDNGHLVPLSNIYPNATQEWLRDTVQSLIVERKLAPFYRGLEDYDEGDGDGSDFDRDEIDKALDKVGDERARTWRTSLYSISDKQAEAAMYKKASECPICFL